MCRQALIAWFKNSIANAHHQGKSCCIISNLVHGNIGNVASRGTIAHQVSRVMSSVSVDSLVTLEAAEGEVQLGVPVLVIVCAGWPGAFLAWRRVAAWKKESRVMRCLEVMSPGFLETRMQRFLGTPVRLRVKNAGEPYCVWE
jgi:hypothetical protein